MVHRETYLQIFSSWAAQTNVILVSTLAVSVLAVALVAWAAYRTRHGASTYLWRIFSGPPGTAIDRAFFDNITPGLVSMIGQHLRTDPRHAGTPTESFTTVDAQLTVYKVPQDGDSMFAALSHQIYGNLLGSPEHVMIAVTLREVVTDHLRNFLDSYEELMFSAVSALWYRYEHLPTVEEKIRAYLVDLSSPGFYGGPEIINLVADIMSNNIAVFAEDETINIVRCVDYAQNLIGLGERKYRDKEGRLYYHYDSIKEVAMLETE